MLKRTVILPVILLLAYNCKAQCSSNTHSLSYDTTIHALGNGAYAFTFPRFNPTQGTLTEVTITTNVTLIYNFKLENGETNPVANYRVKVFRDDEINSTALLDPLTGSFQKQYGYYSLAGSDGIPNSGADFTQQGPLYALDQKRTTYTVYNTADFFGTDVVQFDYTTSTYSAAQGSINNNLEGSAQDAVNFKITYHYCPLLMLATDITSFITNKVNDGTIDIKWTTQNEKNNRQYEIQKSTDGRSYGKIAELVAKTGTSQAGSYSYSYPVQITDNNKSLLFRLKLSEADGSTKYSAVRAVKIKATASLPLKLYPNPAKGATCLIFSNTTRGNWDVNVYSAAGQALKHYSFTNALTGNINTGCELKKGMYMVQLINKTTQEKSVQQLIIQ
ncbi:Por secretion system C-terminal sorting domain-containing protein [Niastella yeongjuensis]|nr:Por secretion system C-terminal sorting domain-containing protein [Niastella yeongjuensis]